MFQYLAIFRKEMCPLSTASMASSRCWFVHLAYLVALGILLVLANLCIFTMGGWHSYYVGAWANCDYGVIVGVTSCGGWFSSCAQVVPEMPFRRFRGTFKCVAM
jgi:hypothetical protein